jgi:DNA-binding transcriptional ArsR family regulator
VHPVTRDPSRHDLDDSSVRDPGNYTEGVTLDVTMADDGAAKDVVDLVGDDYAWQILAETREEDRSAETLSETCDADPSTIYRRIERLEEAELLEAEQQLDPGGHHYKTYRANLDAIHVHLDEDGFTVEIDRREPPADRFTRLYEGFK